MSKPLEALNSGDSFDFALNLNPKCPHCGNDCCISKLEWWNLYSGDGDEHKKECPQCDREFTVKTVVSYRFSTDEQAAA